MRYTPPVPPGPTNRAGVTAVGILLWITAVFCLGYLVWRWAEPFLLTAVAGMFGVDPSRKFRTDCLLLATGAAGVSAILCGLSFCVPAMRALPGRHQFVMLGVLAVIAPLAAALYVV